jgi:broad specificity phosphatase PhoE
MKIILLRHEERGEDVGFFSDLTDNGVKKSFLLYDHLKKLNIDIIFSSPFIRTLRTILYYSIRNDIKINIEYGLYEYIHNPYFLSNKWLFTIDDISIEFKSIINYNYKTIVNEKDFYILEDEECLKNRIIKYIEYLKQNYNDKCILIVTHKGVINKIKDIYFKKTDIDDNFEMGKFEIYNI